jgi:microcystin degradation protein MlrC
MRIAGRHAAGILHRAMTGAIRPVTLQARLPMLGETTGGRTDKGPMLDWLAQARAMEAGDPQVFAVSLNAGFAHADIPEVGPSVLVTCEGDLPRHQAFAEQLADAMWEARFAQLTEYLSVEAAAARCAAWPADSRPLVVADYSDNPGGGAYGDAHGTAARAAAGRRAAACFGPMVDPAVAAQLQDVRSAPRSTCCSAARPIRASAARCCRCAAPCAGAARAYTADGPMIGGQQRNWGPTAVLQVDGVACWW